MYWRYLVALLTCLTIVSAASKPGHGHVAAPQAAARPLKQATREQVIHQRDRRALGLGRRQQQASAVPCSRSVPITPGAQYTGWDYSGNDISNSAAKVTDIAACDRLCRAQTTAKCTGFTFWTDSGDRPRNCFPKTGTFDVPASWNGNNRVLGAVTQVYGDTCSGSRTKVGRAEVNADCCDTTGTPTDVCAVSNPAMSTGALYTGWDYRSDDFAAGAVRVDNMAQCDAWCSANKEATGGCAGWVFWPNADPSAKNCWGKTAFTMDKDPRWTDQSSPGALTFIRGTTCAAKANTIGRPRVNAACCDTTGSPITCADTNVQKPGSVTYLGWDYDGDNTSQGISAAQLDSASANVGTCDALCRSRGTSVCVGFVYRYNRCYPKSAFDEASAWKNLGNDPNSRTTVYGPTTCRLNTGTLAPNANTQDRRCCNNYRQP